MADADNIVLQLLDALRVLELDVEGAVGVVFGDVGEDSFLGLLAGVSLC